MSVNKRAVPDYFRQLREVAKFPSDTNATINIGVVTDKVN